MFDVIIDFWFRQIQPSDWWQANSELDKRITELFTPIFLQAKQCELYHWRSSARGRLAEVILLDQFSRNIFRGTKDAFAQDPLALALAQEAVACGAPTECSPLERQFFYTPYMHSESAAIHTVAVSLYAALGLSESYDAEIQHKAIIDRFGRYPHRNVILGRQSSDQEIAFLQQPGSSF